MGHRETGSSSPVFFFVGALATSFFFEWARLDAKASKPKSIFMTIVGHLGRAGVGLRCHHSWLKLALWAGLAARRGGWRRLRASSEMKMAQSARGKREKNTKPIRGEEAPSAGGWARVAMRLFLLRLSRWLHHRQQLGKAMRRRFFPGPPQWKWQNCVLGGISRWGPGPQALHAAVYTQKNEGEKHEASALRQRGLIGI